ncbi:MAG: tetratricopeptide repeat protein [Desulfobacteraceae bacterium]|jgi:tetratricopeptide (TPR) repeat protein
MANTDELYTRILADGPSPKTLFHLLSNLKKEGQLRRVIQESLKALNAYPNDIHIRRLLAETYFDAGLISQAEAELERVSALIRDLTDTYKLQAEIYMKQNRKEEAIRCLELYLAHRPDDQMALDFLSSLVPKEEAPIQEPSPHIEGTDAKSEKQEVPQVAPSPEEEPPETAMSSLAETYVEQGQIQEAIDTYEMIVALHPEDEFSRGRLEELKGIIAEQGAIEVEHRGEVREKKEKIIAILELWLASIREQFKTA